MQTRFYKTFFYNTVNPRFPDFSIFGIYRNFRNAPKTDRSKNPENPVFSKLLGKFYHSPKNPEFARNVHPDILGILGVFFWVFFGYFLPFFTKK